MTRARDLSRAVNNKMSVFKYTATAGQTTFTGADGGGATLAYDPNSMIVTYNGIILESTSEYTATNGTSVVLAAGAEVGAEVNILAFEDVAYSGVMPTTGGTFTGDVMITGNANDANGNLKVTTNTPTNYPAVVIQTSTGGNGSETHGLHIKNTAAGHGLRVDDASPDTTPFVVASDGKVGVGIETPTAPLHIAAPDNSDLMHFTVTGNERWALRGASGSGSDDYIAFGIDGGTTAMQWHETGKIGVGGKADPDSTLHMISNNTGFVASNGAGINGIQLSRIDNDGENLYMYTSSGQGWSGSTYVGRVESFGNNVLEIGSQQNINISMGTNNAEVLKINSSGVEASGGGGGDYIRCSGLTQGGGGHYIEISGNLSGYTAGQYNCLKTNLNDIHFDAGGTYTGYINRNGGFTDVSDESLKENVATIDSAVSKLSSLKGRYFNWIDSDRGNDRQIGFIAQEVEAVVPELVTTSATGLKGISYGKTTALLVEAIKEQQALIEALTARVTSLEG
jgi:hypothetical protein